MFAKNLRGFYELETFNRPELMHGFSTRAFGNMSYKYGYKEEVVASRNNFARAVGFDPLKIANLELVHGTDVAVITKPGNFPQTDAAITNKSGITLLIVTADCLPLIFFDPIKHVIGIAHSGWRGSIGKIALKTVAKMVAEFDSRPQDILIGIGPAIRSCCYTDNMAPLQLQLPEWSKFLDQQTSGNYSVNLPGFTKKQLLDIGLRRENIDDSGSCTQDDKAEFYCSQLETAGLEKPARFATILALT